MTRSLLTAVLAGLALVDAAAAKAVNKPKATTTTSSARTGTPGPYLIFPKDPASKSDRSNFQSQLADQVGGSDNVWTIIDNSVGPVLWRATLNSTQVTNFRINSVIDQVVPDSNIIVDTEIPSNFKSPDISRRATKKRASLSRHGRSRHKRQLRPSLRLSRHLRISH
jgi:hypothetical protein